LSRLDGLSQVRSLRDAGDITAHLRVGENVLGVLLGNGMYKRRWRTIRQIQRLLRAIKTDRRICDWSLPMARHPASSRTAIGLRTPPGRSPSRASTAARTTTPALNPSAGIPRPSTIHPGQAPISPTRPPAICWPQVSPADSCDRTIPTCFHHRTSGGHIRLRPRPEFFRASCHQSPRIQRR